MTDPRTCPTCGKIGTFKWHDATPPSPKEHVCKPSCHNPCLLDDDRHDAIRALERKLAEAVAAPPAQPKCRCERQAAHDPHSWGVLDGLYCDGASQERTARPAAQTRFDEFDDDSHPFRK